MVTMIKTGNELYSYFQQLAEKNLGLGDQAKHSLQVMVDTQVRKQVLCSTDQGKIVLQGRVCKIVFENLGGGVYNATVNNI